MARSLEEYIREFAKRARNQLEAEIAEKKNQKVRPVEWQGFDADGRPIVKDGDQTRVARGMGNVSQVKGNRLIYDEQGSVEYRRRRKEEVPTVSAEVVRSQPKKTIYRSSLIPLDVFSEAGGIPIKNIIGNYVISYTRWNALYASNSNLTQSNSAHKVYEKTSSGQGSSFNITISLADRSEYYQPSCTNRDCLPEYTTRLEGGSGFVYSVVVAMAEGYTQNLNASPTVANSAEINIGESSGSFTLPLTGGPHEGFVAVSDYGARDSVSISFTGSTGNTPYSAYSHLRWRTKARLILDNAQFFYSFEGNKTVTLDLNEIVTENILYYNKIHEYITREIITNEEQVIVYSVFHIVTVVDEYAENVISANPSNYDSYLVFGKIKHYFVHTKLNLTTEELEQRVSTALKHSSYTSEPLSTVNNFTGSITTEMQQKFPFGAFWACRPYIQSTPFDWDGYIYSYTTPGLSFEATRMLDLDLIFTNAFAGDWIAEINFDTSSYFPNSTYWYKVMNFLKLSYYNGTFDNYRTNDVLRYPKEGPDCSTINSRYADAYDVADLSTITTVSDMDTVVSNVNDPVDLLEDVLDITGWTTLVAADTTGNYGSSNWASGHKVLAPPYQYNLPMIAFQTQSQCYETSSYYDFFMQYLSYTDFTYMFNDTILHDSGPLQEYTASSGTVIISTKFGNSFEPGDTVSISGSGVIDGSHTITQRDSDLTFRISLAIADVATTAIGGTATKQ